ncbi:MAG: ABC transporter permease [Patescibacteria group bacterium]|nr:ABC transporter permease [Patescibacteria group bacterium]
MNAIYILWLRQLIRYFRSKSRIIGSLAQPLLFLIALGFGFGPIYTKAGGGNYIQFLVPGIVGMSIMFTAVFMGIEMIWDRKFGFLKETMVAPVSRFSIMLGRILGGATVATLQGVLVMIISIFVGFRLDNWFLVIPAVVVMFLIALIFTTLGTAIASIMEDMQGFQLIINFLIMPMFFLSGALFPLTGLPPAVTAIALIDPLSYGVDALRGILLGASHISMPLNIVVSLGVWAILLGIGSILFAKMEA